MFGFINLNKPSGFTSHDCVAKIRRLLDMKKIGHGGTLDPLATGVLPIAVGQATRLLQFLPEQKGYHALIRLGVQTTTDDLEGEVIATKSIDGVTPEAIIEHLGKFHGDLEQTPPMYSAIKRQGKKLYELARKGIEVEVPTRKVTIDRCELVSMSRGEFLDIEVDISCGAGTYIRAIARDLGIMLGVGGTLANLIRTESCGLKLSESVTFENIETQLQNCTFQPINPDSLLSHLATVTLNSEQSKRWCYGQTVSLLSSQGSIKNKIDRQLSTETPEIQYLKVIQEDRVFLGIGILQQEETTLYAKPKIVCAKFEK